MAGGFALRAEIFGRFDQAGAEVHLPVAVHRHARGEGIGGIHQPAGQAETVARRVRRHGRQKRGNRGRDLVAGLIVSAAHQHESVARSGHLRHHHGAGDLVFDGAAFGFELGDSFTAHGGVPRVRDEVLGERRGLLRGAAGGRRAEDGRHIFRDDLRVFRVRNRDAEAAHRRAFVLAADAERERRFRARALQARGFDHRVVRLVHFGIDAPAALQLVGGANHEIEFGLFGFEVGRDAGKIDLAVADAGFEQGDDTFAAGAAAGATVRQAGIGNQFQPERRDVAQFRGGGEFENRRGRHGAPGQHGTIGQSPQSHAVIGFEIGWRQHFPLRLVVESVRLPCGLPRFEALVDARPIWRARF